MTVRVYDPYRSPACRPAGEGVLVLFAHDTEVALLGAAALVNTLTAPGDDLPDLTALDAFVARWAWTGERRRGAGELAAVRALRPRLRRLWDSDEHDTVALVNGLLRDGGALPQLVRHGDWGFHLHATPPHAPLADRMAVEAAMAVLDVVRLGELDRLQSCGADGCEQVLVDLSRNRSRRFCSTGCANRTHVAAFRSRHTAGADGRPGH